MNRFDINCLDINCLDINRLDLLPRRRLCRYFFLTPILALVFAGNARAADLLGSAGSFAVLAGSAITSAGPTMIYGNVGVGPGSAITGFSAGTVTNGVVHASDSVAAQAQADLAAAYNALAARTVTRNLTGQDLGTLLAPLAPGVYRFDSAAQLTGTLLLDAGGDSQGIFIFQIGDTLTTASAASVTLTGGAAAGNVYWQVGSSATLGSNSAFRGSIVALTSITLTTGAVIDEGRALARNGAVTLDTNRVVAPPSSPSLSDAVDAPEPGSVALLVSAGAMLLVTARRRRKTSRTAAEA